MEKLDIFVIVYLDDILIYTEDDGDEYVAVVQWCKREVAHTTTWSRASLVTCDSRDAQRDWIEYLRWRSREQKCELLKGVQMTFLRKWRNSGHVKCRYRIIGRLISIKVLWESFHPNTPIKGEL